MQVTAWARPCASQRVPQGVSPRGQMCRFPGALATWALTTKGTFSPKFPGHQIGWRQWPQGPLTRAVSWTSANRCPNQRVTRFRSRPQRCHGPAFSTISRVLEPRWGISPLASLLQGPWLPGAWHRVLLQTRADVSRTRLPQRRHALGLSRTDAVAGEDPAFSLLARRGVLTAGTERKVKVSTRVWAGGRARTGIRSFPGCAGAAGVGLASGGRCDPLSPSVGRPPGTW